MQRKESNKFCEIICDTFTALKLTTNLEVNIQIQVVKLYNSHTNSVWKIKIYSNKYRSVFLDS